MSSHAELSAKFVEASSQRYLPLASHAGEVASAKPSVTCFDSPLSTLCTNTARYIDGSRFTYAIHRLSGLHVGLSERSGTIQGSVSMCFAFPLATSSVPAGDAHRGRPCACHRAT